MNSSFFIEDLCTSSEDEAVCRWRARVNGENSPPAILAFPITSDLTCPSDTGDDDEEEREEDSDQSVEEWMIVDEVELDGDSNIQLNLSYSSISAEENDDEKDVSPPDPWAVSKKDKGIGEISSVCRYYKPGHSLICPICKKTAHPAKNCPLQTKVPVCVLCGIRGHLQRDCPGRPCPTCGLRSHGLRICDRPPVWNQHCQRCGMMGHLSDTCPDNWRQYHQIITMKMPPRIQSIQALKHDRRPVYCYNCSRRGHYGYECSRRRMESGSFIALPYVCHYNIFEKGVQMNSGTQNQNTNFLSGAQPFPEQQHFYEPFGANVKEDQLFQKKNKMKQKTRKTWPERRRERQEVKRLRREAQARREGGVLGQCLKNPGGETLYSDPFGTNHHWQSTRAPNKTQTQPAGDQKSRKIREAERWKKRGGKKCGFLRLHKEMDIFSENLLSTKQRVRHRRR